MKTLLSIGAGLEQSICILRAIERGYKVIMVDGSKDALMLNYDYSHLINNNCIEPLCFVHNLHDVPFLIDLCKKYNVCGLLPQPLGKIIKVSGEINSYFNFKGISYNSTQLFTDKKAVNLKQLEHNIAATTQYKDLESVQFPCMVKPVHGSGSLGAIAVDKKENLQKAINYCLNAVNNEDDYLLENFIEGREYVAIIFVKNKQMHKVQIIAKRSTPLPFRQELEYYNDDDLSEDDKNIIYDTLHANALALDIDNSVVICDLILSNKDNKAYIIDVAGRPIGNWVMHYLKAKGIDMTDLYLDSIIEDKDVVVSDNDSKLCMRFFDVGVGHLVKSPENINMDNIVKVENYLQKGDYLPPIECGKDIVLRGFIITKAKTTVLARKIAQNYIDSFIIEK